MKTNPYRVPDGSRPVACPAGCGSGDYYTSRGITVGCAECARRNPDLVAKLAAEQAEDLHELRQILIAAENWFLSIGATRTPQEAALGLALRARNPRLGVNRGIQINE